MKLKITGTLANPVVADAETGQVLQGVWEVKIRAGGYSDTFRGVEITLKDVDIDLDYVGDPKVVTMDDGKYATSKLSQIWGLVWR